MHLLFLNALESFVNTVRSLDRLQKLLFMTNMHRWDRNENSYKKDAFSNEQINFCRVYAKFFSKGTKMYFILSFICWLNYINK